VETQLMVYHTFVTFR